MLNDLKRAGYGKVRQQGFRHILNQFQDAFVYQLHASGDIQHYWRFLDRAIFGDAVEHLCTLRAVLAMIAKRLHDDPAGFSDPAILRRMNEAVAVLTGHRSRPDPLVDNRTTAPNEVHASSSGTSWEDDGIPF